MWREYIAPEHRDSDPQVGERDGYETMLFENREDRIGLLAGIARKRFEDFKLRVETHEEGRRGGFDPDARVRDMAESAESGGGGGGDR